MWKDRRASSLPPLERSFKNVSVLQRSSSLNHKSLYIRCLKIIQNRKRERAKLTMAQRLEKVAPYNMFFNCLPEVPATYSQPNSIELCDLICPSLGKLKCSLYICFIVDIDWLYACYKERKLSHLPLTVIQGGSKIRADKLPPNVTCKYIKVKDPIGCHDTKMAIYVYEDESVRVSVGSVNPLFCDWSYVNQGIWVSPRCPKLDDSRYDVQGESPTGFKKNLLQYLNYYEEECLKSYIDYVRRANFGEVKVFFIYSVPGTYSNPNTSKCHLHQVGNALSRFCHIPDENPAAWKVIGQAPTMGLLYKKKWENISYYELLSKTLSKHNKQRRNEYTEMNIIFPTAINVIYALEMRGSIVSYPNYCYKKQTWLNNNMLQWRADAYNRTKIIPHIRSYFRMSPCSKKIAYFLLTSANLVRSGWGVPSTYAKDQIYMRNYDVGVLFIPKFFDEEYFRVQELENNENGKLFPFLFNLPLVPYEHDDVPWINPNETVNSSDDSDSSEDSD